RVLARTDVIKSKSSLQESIHRDRRIVQRSQCRPSRILDIIMIEDIRSTNLNCRFQFREPVRHLSIDSIDCINLSRHERTLPKERLLPAIHYAKAEILHDLPVSERQICSPGRRVESSHEDVVRLARLYLIVIDITSDRKFLVEVVSRSKRKTIITIGVLRIRIHAITILS